MTLAVLALVLKVAIPAGFMVEARADAAPAIVLCTAQGAVTIKAATLIMALRTRPPRRGMTPLAPSPATARPSPPPSP